MTIPAGARIFLVDDDAAVRDSLKLLLECHGILVEDYGSTLDFAEHYRPRPPECLILDQHLPTVSGLDFLASPRGAALSLPVILMTGRGDRGLRQQAMRAGVTAYLEKPVSEDLLLAVLARVFGTGDPAPGSP